MSTKRGYVEFMAYRRIYDSLSTYSFHTSALSWTEFCVGRSLFLNLKCFYCPFPFLAFCSVELCNISTWKSPRARSVRVHHSARKKQPTRDKWVRVQGVQCVRLWVGLVGKAVESLCKSRLLSLQFHQCRASSRLGSRAFRQTRVCPSYPQCPFN